MLTVCTWLWGKKFSVDDVRKLRDGIARHLVQPHRFLLVTDDMYRPAIDGMSTEDVIPIIRDLDLTKVKGCFARLRMFDPEWQHQSGVTDRLVCIDLDTIITGQLDPLFDRPEPFVIMQGGNSANPCRYNGALMMLRPGYRPDVWSDFSIEAARKVPFYEFPDDQGWLWHKIPDSAGWMCGKESGVYVFHKPGWPGWTKNGLIGDDELPIDARLVTFSGWRSPARFSHLDWVKEHWL